MTSNPAVLISDQADMQRFRRSGAVPGPTGHSLGHSDLPFAPIPAVGDRLGTDEKDDSMTTITTPAPTTTRRPRKEQEPGHGLTPRARQRRTLLRFMTTGCREHHARSGEPCWVLPSGVVLGAEHMAVCGPRIRRATSGGQR